MSSTNASPQAGTPENAAISAAGTLAVDTARSTGALALRRVQLTGRPYRAMLEGYVCRRLALSPRHKPADAQLLDAIIETADHRFAYVAFLTERCQRGREDADSLRRAAADAPADPPANDGTDASGDAAAAAPTAGEALYRRWLAGLHLEYGHKLAERMRAVLALLHVAEQAHAWVFGAGRIEHPVTGAALTPLPEQFQGLPLAVLQTLLLLDPPRQAAPAPLVGGDIGPDSPEPATRPADDQDETSRPPAGAYNPALLLTLQQLQGVLAVHRGGSGTSRFRIGLKDLGPALAQDERIAPLVRRAPALLACAALDAVEGIAAGSKAAPDGSTPQPNWRPSGQPDWPLFEALAPLLDGLAATAGSDPVAARWRGLRGTAMRLLSTESDALRDDSRTDLNLPVLTLLAAWAGAIRDPRAAPIQDQVTPETERRNALAGGLSNRGLAHHDNGDLAAAIRDYDAAIGLGKGIRDKLGATDGEAAWSLPGRNQLATARQNRGNAHQDKGDLAAAIADYDAAVELREGIRDSCIATGGEATWSIPYRNDLAMVLQNRGVAHRNNGDIADAIADCNAAIGLREGIRDSLIARGGEAAWSIPYRNDLAAALQSRGSAHADNGYLAAAIADFDAAIGLREGIRDSLIATGGEAAWSIRYRNDLTAVLQDRGLAHQYNGNLAAAIADSDAAIGLGEGIRESLVAAGGEAAWSLPYRNDLARALQNRGTAHAANGDHAAAIADFDAAIGLREDIRDRLVGAGDKAAWSIPYRDDLAHVLQNRGVARRNNGDIAAAIDDYDAAIELGEDIRDSLIDSGGEAAWSLTYRRSLAMAHQNRGAAHASGGDLAAAIAEFEAAIELGEGIRDRFIAVVGEAAWPAPLRVDLARTYVNRARTLGPVRGQSDLAAAMKIGHWLRAEGHARDAAQVAKWGASTQLAYWQSRAGRTALRKQTPTVFWLTLGLNILLAPLLLPIALLVRVVRWLRRRAG